MPDTIELSEAAVKLLPALEALSINDRLGLAARLLAEPEVSPADQTEIRAAWKTEIRRRIEEIRSGKVEGIPAEEVFRRMREKYG